MKKRENPLFCLFTSTEVQLLNPYSEENPLRRETVYLSCRMGESSHPYRAHFTKLATLQVVKKTKQWPLI